MRGEQSSEEDTGPLSELAGAQEHFGWWGHKNVLPRGAANQASSSERPLLAQIPPTH